jgi:hypothetical protein
LHNSKLIWGNKGVQQALSCLHHQFEWNDGKGESGNDGKGFANCTTEETAL